MEPGDTRRRSSQRSRAIERGGDHWCVASHVVPDPLDAIDHAGIGQQLALERGENPLLTSSAEDFDRLLGFVSYKRPFVPWPVKGVLAQQSFENSTFNRRIFDSYKDTRAVGLESILADIRQPVLIIWGEFDRVLDVSSIEVMRPLLPQAKVVIMQDTGHIPMLERPQETATHYLEFLGGL